MKAFGAAKGESRWIRENLYSTFIKPAKKISLNTRQLGAIGQLPRCAIEIIIFGGMLLVILYLMAKSNVFSSIIPIITLYAFAGYRIIPAIQQIIIVLLGYVQLILLLILFTMI